MGEKVRAPFISRKQVQRKKRMAKTCRGAFIRFIHRVNSGMRRDRAPRNMCCWRVELRPVSFRMALLPS